MGRLLTLLAFLFTAVSGWADGMVMGSYALPANVRIPDQRALIQFSNGVERLVIETRFTGAGTNFAWVVPLPSPPVIEEASTGLFPTLQCIFQPRLWHDVPHYFQWFMGLLAGGYLLRYVRRNSPMTIGDVLACLCGALAVFGETPLRGMGSVAVLLGLLNVVDNVRNRGSCASRLFFYSFFIVITAMLAGMMLPTLGRAGGGVSNSPAVSVLDRKLVGVFDTATISSRDPAALQGWLKANGFAAPASRSQAIAGYVKDGWVFVAAKIRRDDPALQTATPHPLSFTFATTNAVYPMRLTGIDNGPVQVELYVFGAGRADTPHFKVERCAMPVYPKLPLHHGIESMSVEDLKPNPDVLQIAHPLLRKWVDGSAVATKLSATLSPDEMRDDIWISWKPFSEKKSFRFSREGAMIYAANWGSGLIAFGLLAAFVFGPGSAARAKHPAKIIRLVLCSGVLLSAIVYGLLPKTEVRIVRSYRSPVFQTRGNFEYVDRVCFRETNLADVRDRMTTFVSNYKMENYLSGGLFREEDSSGNYQLRQGSNAVQAIFYDAIGAPSSE
jgi:hypothetical protein